MIADRAAPLIESGEVTVLFAGDGPDGFAELRFRPSLYTGALDAHLEELYVLPERRGHGLGRALLEAAMEHARERGAAHIDLGTGESDVAARALYESAGFTNREGGPEGRGCSTTSGTSRCADDLQFGPQAQPRSAGELSGPAAVMSR